MRPTIPPMHIEQLSRKQGKSLAEESLSPVTEKSHQTSTKRHKPKRLERPTNRPILHVRAKHKLMRHELHQTGINQDTRTDRIKNAIGEKRSTGLWSKRLADTQTNGNSNRGGETVADAEKVRGPALGSGPGDFGETGAQTEALEHLVED